MGAAKLSRVRQKMAEAKVGGFLVTSHLNWRYLSGFKGDAGMLLITDRSAYLYTDSRYTEEATEEAPDFTVIQTGLDDDPVKDTLNREGIKQVAFEKEHVTFSLFEKFQTRFEGVELKGVAGWIEDLRMVKTPEEIALITRAQEIADEAFSLITRSIKVGVTELEMALDLEFTMRRLGAEGLAFPIIAVSGARSSLPHGQPTANKVSGGDFLTFDFGARYEGYCSDETRTFVIGPLDKKHKEVYEVVLEAQMAGLEAAKPGVLGKDIDKAARKVIDDAGYGQYFGHGAGHGVGLNVHEGPSAGKKGDTVLVPGMVVTVEPGIYIPGFGGCRIEDLVVITEGGKEILSSSPKDLTVID
ncbi:MAG: M24 family metallopeptidase [Bacillota bacterium]|jgi:Xaa-Pro aminopeptidase